VLFSGLRLFRLGMNARSGDGAGDPFSKMQLLETQFSLFVDSRYDVQWLREIPKTVSNTRERGLIDWGNHTRYIVGKKRFEEKARQG
jgi:hypothetical protein